MNYVTVVMQRHLRRRVTDFEAQTELAASTDFPPGE
jgi:hypothetical protein